MYHFKQLVAAKYDLEASVSVWHVETSIKKFLNQFFSDYNLPMPRIKIVNHTGSKWLGRCKYNSRIDKNNTTIEIQKKVTSDEKSLDRIIAHELIHHWEFITRYTNPINEKREKAQEMIKSHDPLDRESHGKIFQEWADKINSVMGKDYVTTKSDMTYVIVSDKEFYVLVMPSPTYAGKYAWAWAVKPSKDLLLYIARHIEQNKAKLFKTKDEDYTTGSKLKKYGGASVSMDKEFNTKLEQMYNSGKEIQVTTTRIQQ